MNQIIKIEGEPREGKSAYALRLARAWDELLNKELSL
jgi:hypothetical protein